MILSNEIYGKRSIVIWAAYGMHQIVELFIDKTLHSFQPNFDKIGWISKKYGTNVETKWRENYFIGHFRSATATTALKWLQMMMKKRVGNLILYIK